MNTKRTATERLRLRADTIRGELRGIDRKLAALAAFRCDAMPANVRIQSLLGDNPDLAFTPAEIIEAVGAPEGTTRRLLLMLHTDGRIQRTSFARYQARVS